MSYTCWHPSMAVNLAAASTAARKLMLRWVAQSVREASGVVRWRSRSR